jgi:hypothetical protein
MPEGRGMEECDFLVVSERTRLPAIFVIVGRQYPSSSEDLSDTSE